MSEEGPAGQIKEREATAQTVGTRTGNLGREQRSSLIVYRWGEKAKEKLELNLAREAKNKKKKRRKRMYVNNIFVLVFNDNLPSQTS